MASLPLINPLNKLIDDLAISTDQNELERIKFYLNGSSATEFAQLPTHLLNHTDCRQLLVNLKNKYPGNFLNIYEELFSNLKTKNALNNMRKIVDYKVSHLCSVADVSVDKGYRNRVRSETQSQHMHPPSYCEYAVQTRVKELDVNEPEPRAAHNASADAMLGLSTTKQPTSELQLDLQSSSYDQDEIIQAEVRVNKIVCQSQDIGSAFCQVGNMFKRLADKLTQS